MRAVPLVAVAAIVGLCGAFVHHWASPVGLFLALGALAGMMYLGRQWLRSRVTLGIMALAWLAPIITMASERPEGDLVIQADIPGLVLIFGGASTLAISLGMGTAAGKLRRFA